MAKQGSNTNKLTQALSKTSALITSLANSLSDEASSHQFGQSPWMSFSRGEEGGLTLSGDEMRHYQECLDDLSSAVDTDTVSRKAIDGYLKDAILAALDMNHRQPDTSFDQRTKDALAHLKQKVVAPSTTFQVHYRISGLEPTVSSNRFGRITFTVFDDAYLQPMKESIKRNAKDDESRDIRLERLSHFTEESLLGKTVAIVEVPAIDVEAARSKALKELLLTIDVINFYSDILYGPRQAYISVYGSEERTWESVPVFIPGDEPAVMQQQRPTGRRESFAINNLLYGRGQPLGSERISAILANSTRNEIEERLLSAMQWAGRATIDERQEEAFLLYAIALECLIMERGV